MGQKISKHETKIKECDGALCESDYQDARYGKGRRLHNPCPRTDGSVGYRCTVCAKEGSAKGGPASVRRRAQVHALQVGHGLLMARLKTLTRKTYDSKKRKWL